MRTTIAGICNKHGYYSGSDCLRCIEEEGNSSNEIFFAKDKLWEFTDYHLTGKPIEIRSRGQWRKLLKEYGKHDDCSVKDLMTEKSRHDRNTNERTKKETRKTAEEAWKWAKQRSR